MKRAYVLAAVALASLVSRSAQAYEDQEELPPLPTSEPAPLPAPPPVEPAAATPKMPPAAPRYPARFELQVGGGATYRRIFGLPMTMGSFDFGIGAHVAEMVAFHVTVDGDFGKTTHGLTSRAATISPTIELVDERFRLGVGPELVWFGIWRATTGSVIARGGVGARLLATFDILKTEHTAIFLGGRGQVEWLFPAGLWSATAAAGLRF